MAINTLTSLGPFHDENGYTVVKIKRENVGYIRISYGWIRLTGQILRMVGLTGREISIPGLGSFDAVSRSESYRERRYNTK